MIVRSRKSVFDSGKLLYLLTEPPLPFPLLLNFQLQPNRPAKTNQNPQCRQNDLKSDQCNLEYASHC